MIEITEEHNKAFESMLRYTYLALGLKECNLEKNYKEHIIGPIFEEMSHVEKRAKNFDGDIILETITRLCDSIADDHTKRNEQFSRFEVAASMITTYNGDKMKGIIWGATIFISQ
jgi:hypothetical protein